MADDQRSQDPRPQLLAWYREEERSYLAARAQDEYLVKRWRGREDRLKAMIEKLDRRSRAEVSTQTTDNDRFSLTYILELLARSSGVKYAVATERITPTPQEETKPAEVAVLATKPPTKRQQKRADRKHNDAAELQSIIRSNIKQWHK
jgi:hypothetical protein